MICVWSLHALLAWLVKCGSNTDPMFQFQSGSLLILTSSVKCLKEALVASGIEPDHYSGHSFRIETAQLLL